MYIGPWQEFKLAKILHLKDKIDKEADEDNKLDSHEVNQTKAISVSHKQYPKSEV
jgi:hypothetical protein